MAKADITFEGLSFRYDEDGNEVIDDISLDIPHGKVTAILGPNGAGKTTLLHLLLGYLKPLRGDVLVRGEPHHSYSRREMGRLFGLVPQWEYTPFNFSVLEYVLLGRAPYLDPLQMPTNEDCQVALDSLQKLNILHLKDRPLPGLSGGERQIVLLARALAQQTEILLLDEPTAHLDLGNQKRILVLLSQLTQQGITSVMTTHDPNIAAYIGDHLVFMRDGQIFAHGGVDEVLTEENLASVYNTPVVVERLKGRLVVFME
ncbi:MAG: ABC transporter ATP-binding protein [Anaerolineales bacterium]|jgi:iron complex transport system ATP-binding protein